jgi:thiopeptide-type bacteriocin biosynthesis protein
MKPALHASLSDDLIGEISKAVEILRQLWNAPRRDLSLFRAAFLERYGVEREVPLVEALDPDIGIAFALSSTMSLDAFGRITAFPLDGRSEQDRSWTRRDTHLLKLITRSLTDGSNEIMLDQQDVEQLRAEFPLPLPDAFAVQVSIAAYSETDLARGRFRVSIRNVQGPSGARLFGRFCHFDDLLLQRTREHIHSEESLRPGALFAEIVHLPTGRTGNVLLRPQLRDYEIPYLGGSGNPVSKQIPVTDLCVTVIDGRIVLRSISLQREVIPRLTAAHYYYGLSGLNVYRFLCLLQDQGQASELEWDWGLAAHSPFLPRVSFRRLVLSRARWNMDTNELLRLRNISRSESVKLIQEWRAERKWPRWVALVDDDNELPIDLDNVLCNDTLAEILKGVESATLVEVFPTPDELCVRSAEGRFAHEIIVPFVGVRSSTEVHSGNSTSSTRTVKRSFAPGSEWLYFKLYTGESTADQLLREFVRPFVEDALNSGNADQWFFIRYGDPFWHIRLRFHGAPDRLHTSLLSAFKAAVDPFMSAGKVWRMQIDTYERETERYGGIEGILLAEKIFQADSEAVLTIIESLAGNEGIEARRLIALRSIDLLLDSFALDISSKHQVMEKLCDEFAGPFATTPGFRNRIGTTYRKVHKTIESAIDGTREMQASFARAFAALDRRSQQTSSAIGRLKACAKAGQLSVPLTKVISSFVHLHANRMLRPASPGEELLLYHMLARFYRTRIARTRT